MSPTLIWSKRRPSFLTEKISVKNYVESSNLDFSPKLSKVIFLDALVPTYFLAGVQQRHYIHNTFNVLVNEGFLRDQQGVQSLEVVQKFYEITKLTPRNAKKVEKDILDLCPTGSCVHSNQAVITCVEIDSTTKAPYYHAVKVSKKTIYCILVNQKYLVGFLKQY